MNGKILLIAAIGALIPLSVWGTELSAGYYGYTNQGAAEYQLLDGQQLMCEDCPVIAQYKPAVKAVFSEHVKLPKEDCFNMKCTAETTYEEPKSAWKPEISVAFKPLETVYFRLGSYVLSAGEKAKLDELAKGIKSQGVKVEGYTCRIGSHDFNKKLSMRRAKVVASYLKAHGIIVEDIAAYGETRPSGEGLKKDRRAVILIKEASIDN